MKRVNKGFARALLLFLIFATLLIPDFGNFAAEVAAADSPSRITLQVSQGSPDVVSGTVTGVAPGDVRVVVFVRTNQWYIQPYADERAYLTVNADGTYETWIRNWSQISVFVIRKGYNALSGQQIYRPFPLSVDGADVLAIAAYPTVQFSGYEWAVKAGDLLGPGPNYFSSSHDNVWVDDQDRLHLKITQRDGKWYCAEVYLMQSFGYGTYNFQLSNRVDMLDKYVIGSPFVYRNDTNELDMEFSRWGIEDGPNAQFVVQPYYNPGNREQFSMSLSNNASTHIIKWKSDSVFFQSAQGHYSDPPEGQVIHQWGYTGGYVPSESDELVHINLWLLNGQAFSEGQAAEMVIQDFTFYVDECTPPPSGDWMVSQSCTLLESASVSGNVCIKDGAVLTIGQNATLHIE